MRDIISYCVTAPIVEEGIITAINLVYQLPAVQQKISAYLQTDFPQSCLAFSRLSEVEVQWVATNPALQDILRFFLHSGVDVTEATLRMTLWDRLLVHLLDSSKPDVLVLRSEFSLVEKLELVERRIADIAALCNQKQSVVLLVEASKEKVLPGFQHKDFSKMSTAMIQLCLANCKGFCSMGKDICRVRVFGIWVGGSQARFCMVHPKIHVDGTGRKQISIMLSAPDCWTFDLLGPQSGSFCHGPRRQPLCYLYQVWKLMRLPILINFYTW